MNTEQEIELARQAIAVIRLALGGESRQKLVGTDSATEREALLCSLYLLGTCCDPEELEAELQRFDAALADRLADALIAGVDLDAVDWSG